MRNRKLYLALGLTVAPVIMTGCGKNNTEVPPIEFEQPEKEVVQNEQDSELGNDGVIVVQNEQDLELSETEVMEELGLYMPAEDEVTPPTYSAVTAQTALENGDTSADPNAKAVGGYYEMQMQKETTYYNGKYMKGSLVIGVDPNFETNAYLFEGITAR